MLRTVTVVSVTLATPNANSTDDPTFELPETKEALFMKGVLNVTTVAKKYIAPFAANVPLVIVVVPH